MATVKKQKNDQFIDSKAFAWWVLTFRKALGYSQETLAELSNCSVKTVQRVEGGKSSSLDTRRCIAQGLGYEDMDVFEKHENINNISVSFNSFTEEVNKQFREENFPDSMFVKATQVMSGKELGTLAESLCGAYSNYDDKCANNSIKIFSEIIEYIQEYGDTHDLYSLIQKLDVYSELDKMISELSDNGYGFYCSTKRVSFKNNTDINRKALTMTMGYFALYDKDIEVLEFAVPKTVSF